MFTQLTRADIQFKIVETQYTRAWCGGKHINAQKVGRVYHTSYWSESGLLRGWNTFIFNGLTTEKTLGMDGGREDCTSCRNKQKCECFCGLTNRESHTRKTVCEQFATGNKRRVKYEKLVAYAHAVGCSSGA